MLLDSKFITSRYTGREMIITTIECRYNRKWAEINDTSGSRS